MVINRRQGKVFISALLLGAAAVAGAWKRLGSGSSAVPDETKTSGPPPQQAPDKPDAAASSAGSPAGPDKSEFQDTLPSSGFYSGKAGGPGPLPPPAGLTSRQLAVFAFGFVLAAAALVGAWIAWESASSPGAYRVKTSAAPPGSGSLAACALPPATPASGETDGKFPLQTDVSGLIAADIATFIVVGKEAAAAGRPRDAELAFLMSCRVAGALTTGDSVEFADAKYQLGSHYARVALEGNPGSEGNRAELLRRAESLYADSVQAYRTRYGEAHEKSRFAAQGLATVRQKLAQAPSAPPESATAPQLANRADGPAPPPALRKVCPDAVAALGLCNPDS